LHGAAVGCKRCAIVGDRREIVWPLPHRWLVSDLLHCNISIGELMSHRLAALAAVAIAGATAACGPEITSFRTTDRSDPQRIGPPSAAYEVLLGGQLAATAHVWSTGGYVSSADEPMTQVGFEIDSRASRPLTFDAEALELVVYDETGAALPATRFTAITPLGPALVTVPAASTVVLGAYFALPVRPRSVASMVARWTLRGDADEYRQVTGFVRDDDAQVVERVSRPDPRFPSS
jgi:hypothetical protein